MFVAKKKNGMPLEPVPLWTPLDFCCCCLIIISKVPPFCPRFVVVDGDRQRLVDGSFNHLDEGVVQHLQGYSCRPKRYISINLQTKTQTAAVELKVKRMIRCCGRCGSKSGHFYLRQHRCFPPRYGRATVSHCPSVGKALSVRLEFPAASFVFCVSRMIYCE